MANHTNSDKLLVCVENSSGGNVISDLTLNEHDLSRVASRQINNRSVKLLSNSFVAIDSPKVKINRQHTGATLNKYEHIYRNDNLTLYKQRSIMMEHQSMLAYTQKMHELATRKNLVLTPERNSNPVSTGGTGRRWATLQKLRRQAVDLRSVSDSQWNYGQRQRQIQHNTERPKSEVNFMVRNNNSQQLQVTTRPRSESDGLLYFNDKTLTGRNKGYHYNETYILDKAIGDSNLVPLPEITDSMDSFNMNGPPSVQIVPFPGIEVQAVPAVLHNNNSGITKKDTQKQLKSKTMKDTHKTKISNVNTRGRGKLIYHNNQKLTQTGIGKPSSSSEIVDKETKQEIGTDSKLKSNKVRLKPITSPAKRPSAALVQKIKLKAQEKTSEEQSTESSSDINCENNIVFETNDGITTQDIKSVLKKASKTGNEKRHKKSVQFGERMVREVTKIVYPWNKDPVSSDEDFQVSDDIDVYIHEDDGTDDSDDLTDESDDDSVDIE